MPKMNLSHFEAAFLFSLFTSVVLGVVTTIAVAWGFAAYGRVGGAGQSVLNTPDRSVS